ncbi:hypothetical protein [Hymenobacter latericus]|uniref:hypothetical protein n=1 Tax=Hymenobacter sp. YIM 151858-1 TaxID=2987688 RepID=UPI0022265D7A|nr:hypothetical protein [Hymenobacter sp. YIM 151858-1]UYZ60067.1 hypothetical protein OIS50_04525 [Hymenobacter sp. YIM 151858-1]
MPAFAYPIKINRSKEVIPATFTEYTDSTRLTLKELEPIVGANPFSVSEDTSGYRIEVYATRLETDEEYNARISRQEAYMAEYNRRKQAKH